MQKGNVDGNHEMKERKLEVICQLDERQVAGRQPCASSLTFAPGFVCQRVAGRAGATCHTCQDFSGDPQPVNQRRLNSPPHTDCKTPPWRRHIASKNRCRAQSSRLGGIASDWARLVNLE